MDLPTPINAIIFAFLCNDESKRFFSESIEELFFTMYVGDLPNCVLEIGPKALSIRTGLEYEHFYNLETRAAVIYDVISHAIITMDDKLETHIMGHGVPPPSPDELPKLTLEDIDKLDPTGEFGLKKLFDKFICDGSKYQRYINLSLELWMEAHPDIHPNYSQEEIFLEI